MTSEQGDAPGRIEVTLLGTGTSVGIPIIGCDCETCLSADPRDSRTRCSCLLEIDGLVVLIDTSADFRAQALAHGIRHIDAVLFTHHHFDHIAGIDDLRPYLFDNRRPIPCFGHPETVVSLKSKYDYIVGERPHPSAPGLNLHSVKETFSIRSRRGMPAVVDVTPIRIMHGELEIYGFRMGRFAYVTDASALSDTAISELSGVDTLVLNALRPKPHPTHFSVAQAIDAANNIGARITYFVHMTHDILHARDDAALPSGFRFGYDGLRLSVSG